MIKRKASMEFNVIKQLFTKNEETFFNKVIQSSEFMERILLNSESLYNKITKIKDNNLNIDNKTKKTLLKYILRIATRPQPNRLNSGICLDQSDKFNGKRQIKEVAISLEWEQNLIKKIEDYLLTASNIKLILNPTLYKIDKQYILESVTKDNISHIYIEDTVFLDMLFESLRDYISLQDILKLYKEDSDKKLVLDVLQNLIKADVIRTELSSYSINRDSETFIKKLKQFYQSNKTLVSDLKEIQSLLELYRNAEIGEGIELYQSLIKKMSKLCESSSYLNIDLYIYDAMEEREEIIDQIDVEKSLKIMNFFDKRQGFDWKNYYNLFVSRYGVYTRVPLLQMINKDDGIGLPKYSQSNKKDELIEQYILNRIMQNSLSDTETLKLTSTDYKNIKDIYSSEGEDRIPISYDCKMVPYEDKVILPPNAFSFPRKSFTGRFSLLEKEQLITQSKYSEVNYITKYAKDVGLTYKSEAGTFIDCIGHVNNSLYRIPLNNIDVIANEDRIYMVHENEVIYPISTHLLSYRNFNEHPALIFLNEYYRDCFEYPSDFQIDKFSYLEFIPRIEYKELILSPARINVKFKKESTKEERINKLSEVIKRYNLNKFKYIYFLEGDRSLPVPTNNHLSIDFLEGCKRKTSEGYELVLIEAPELENVKSEICDWIYSSDHKTSEGEIPKKHNLQKTIEISKLLLDKIDPSVSSYSVYYRNGKRNKVEKYLLELSEELSLKDSFLVNFIDETHKEHIRLRYNKETNKDTELESRLSNLLVIGDIYDFKKTLFTPEVNRYGGQEIYKLVYKLFSIDTKSMGIFKKLYENYDDIGKALYLSSYNLISLLKNDVNLLYDYLESSIKRDTKYVKPFARRRNKYRDIVLQALHDHDKLSNSILLEHQNISNEIIKVTHDLQLSNEEFYYLIRSIIHMSMNRHFPFKRDLEIKANQYMRFSFSNVGYYLGRIC